MAYIPFTTKLSHNSLKTKNDKISPFKIFGLKLYRRNPSKCDDLILYWTKVRTQDIIVNIHVVFLFLCLYCWGTAASHIILPSGRNI